MWCIGATKWILFCLDAFCVFVFAYWKEKSATFYSWSKSIRAHLLVWRIDSVLYYISIVIMLCIIIRHTSYSTVPMSIFIPLKDIIVVMKIRFFFYFIFYFFNFTHIWNAANQNQINDIFVLLLLVFYLHICSYMVWKASDQLLFSIYSAYPKHNNMSKEYLK